MHAPGLRTLTSRCAAARLPIARATAQLKAIAGVREHLPLCVRMLCVFFPATLSTDDYHMRRRKSHPCPFP